MFKLLIFTAVFLLFSGDIYADDIQNLCGKVKSSKNNANYVEGIDVKGNKVTPADLNSNISSPLYNLIIIPIRFDLAQRYGLNLPLGADLKPTIADIKIFSDGTIKYNDADISNNISKLCDSYDSKDKNIQYNQSEQHGHESSDPVISSDKIEGSFPHEEIAKPRYND